MFFFDCDHKLLSKLIEDARNKKNIGGGKKHGFLGPCSYTKSSDRIKSLLSAPLVNIYTQIDINCERCKTVFEKQQRRMECGFCGPPYCQQYSGLTKSAFDALYNCGNGRNASWYCDDSVRAVPCVKKNFWVRIGNVEAQCESVNERVETHGEKKFVSSETVKSLIRDEVAEIKRIDRK